MARVIRLHWRLDFDVSYPYLDKRGTALKALSETVEGFWTTVGPATLPLSFAAEKVDKTSHTVFSWEMSNLNGSLEWPTGIDIERVFENPEVRACDRIVKEALKIADVRFVNRAGIRLFCVEKFAKRQTGSAVDRVAGLVGPAFRDGLKETMGRTDDFAVIYEGSSEDGLAYRLQMGPYLPKNPRMVFLRNWEELSQPLDENDLFFDIDIFEKKFSFSEHSLFRWGSTKVTKAANFIEFCAKNIR